MFGIRILTICIKMGLLISTILLPFQPSLVSRPVGGLWCIWDEKKTKLFQWDKHVTQIKYVIKCIRKTHNNPVHTTASRGSANWNSLILNLRETWECLIRWYKKYTAVTSFFHLLVAVVFIQLQQNNICGLPLAQVRTVKQQQWLHCNWILTVSSSPDRQCSEHQRIYWPKGRVYEWSHGGVGETQEVHAGVYSVIFWIVIC